MAISLYRKPTKMTRTEVVSMEEHFKYLKGMKVQEGIEKLWCKRRSPGSDI
jgi:hypothetical protein